MSVAFTETPEPGRYGRLSSLDFAYWVISSSTMIRGRDNATVNFAGLQEDEQDSVDIVVNAASQCGLVLPNEYGALYSLCATRRIPTRVAQHTRGSLLFRGRGIAVALGDRTRIVEAKDGDVIVRFMTADETLPNFWDAMLIPGMDYL